MTLPSELADLLNPAAYADSATSPGAPASGSVQVVETHISWVLLTGEFAYKLKKPVRFPFVDFSTLERRAHFCREELRCNRRFAPSLYLDVVPVTRLGGGRLVMGEADGEVVDWAVKMRQFDPDAQLDRVLARGALLPEMLARFGASLSGVHAQLPAGRFAQEELEARVLGPVRDNYRDLEGLQPPPVAQEELARGRRAMERQVADLEVLLLRRFTRGWFRECHGDLHLSNLVALEQGVVAFDCLEFDPALRWIDPVSDVAFLFMDCLVRQRADLAYAFLDGYLDVAGDYQGMVQLAFYASYRSMVRAKVAALRRQQAEPSSAAQSPSDELGRRCAEHIRWATAWLERPPGRLVLMCGVSGSGKSWLAQRLVPHLPAIRLRSDVARKVRAGLAPGDRAAEAPGAGLYDADTTHATYDWLLDVAGRLLRTGENVLVDATFLEARQRAPFVALAQRLGRPAVVVYCQAPRAVLEARIRGRSAAGGDPSDADVVVLDHQLARFEPPDGRVVDTRHYQDPQAVAQLAARLLA